MKKRFNVIAAAVLALGMVVGMCGCEGQLPQPKTTQRQDAPNLTAKQEKTIRTNILKTLDQCNNDRNIDALGSILEGPELEIRTSELHVAQVTGNLDRKTTIPTDLAQAVISTDSGWPRSVFSITSTTDDHWELLQPTWRIRASELQVVGCGTTVLGREDAEFRDFQNR